MIAPEIIVVERLKICVDGDDAGAGSIHRQRGHVIPGNLRGGNRLARGLRQSAHVIVVALGGEIGIVFPPMQRILANARTKAPRAESTMDTRTLRVPKSTPATIAKRFILREVS